MSTNGDTHLGGDDFDQVIIDWLVDGFKQEEGVDLSKDPMALQRLKDAAEKAKIELSSANTTEINLPYITSVEGTPKHLVKTLTRAHFEQLAKDIVERSIAPCEKALADARLEAKDIDEVILVGGSTRIPILQETAKRIFGKEPSKAVNPDEAVAMGAAIQAAILNKEDGVGDIVLLDVTPLNLGIETLGGVMTTLIEANTTIPCHKEEVFSTASDNQTSVAIAIRQGNRPMAKDNKLIGQFILDGIMPAPKGIPQIVVSFDVNASGLLNVSAKDKATGKEQSIRIEASSNLSKEEIERMKAEAEANAEADKKEREIADTINKGDSIVFAQEKLMKEQKDNINEEEKAKLEGLIKQMKDAVKDKNVGLINSTEIEINNLWQNISQRVYANQGNPTQNSSDSQDDTAKDAEFEEVK